MGVIFQYDFESPFITHYNLLGHVTDIGYRKFRIGRNAFQRKFPVHIGYCPVGSALYRNIRSDNRFAINIADNSGDNLSLLVNASLLDSYDNVFIRYRITTIRENCSQYI